MKTTTFAVAAVSLLQLALAQPFRGRRHAHLHGKKDIATAVTTVYAEASDTPEVMVYVDQNGTPYSTTTVEASPAPVSTQAHAPASSAAPVASSSSSSAYVEPVASTPVASSSAAKTSSAATSSSSSSSSGSSGFGLSYSPYKADGTCKTQDEINADFDIIGTDYKVVRTYGTDCNQVAMVLSAAKSKGMKMFAGIFDLATLNSEIATIVSAANGDWSDFMTISIGNELVNSGTASASDVVAAIGTAQKLLKAAGYSGDVVTVDTLVAARANPSLCNASSYCAVNCHPFFDGNTVAEDSGSFLTAQIPTLQAVLANKNQKVVITETGWPTQGQTNDKAVPSKANQQSAISSIKSAFTNNQDQIILFTAFNDMWKTNTAAQFDAEQYWGFMGASAS